MNNTDTQSNTWEQTEPIQSNSIQSNSIQSNSIQSNSIQSNSTQSNSTQSNSTQSNSIQNSKEPEKAPTSESRMWLYASSPLSDKPVKIFEYQPDRSGKHAATMLKGYTGLLVTDGYAGYNAVITAIHCGCWVHMRRYWRDAMPDGATTKNSKAAIGFEYCNKIFALERKFEGFTVMQRQDARKNNTEPILEAYWNWVEKLEPAEGSKLKDAVTYARNQKAALSQFINYGEVEISNNTAENAIRPFVIGRKNWLFSDSVKGAESSAIIYSIVETAKANDLEPYAYLNYILDKIRYLGKTPAAESVELLMPWSKTVQKALNSDIIYSNNEKRGGK